MCNPKYSRNKRHNNKGSAIITVVVAMLFVMAIGAALLFAAYTGYSVEITQRHDKENFYDASTAMDDMRLGVQTMLSDSIAKAYTRVLTKYVGVQEADYDAQVDFNNEIKIELLSKKTIDGQPFFDKDSNYTSYNTKAFETLINNMSVVEVTGGGTNSVTITASTITIKALSVKCTTTDGYESNITSDITITMPYFFASSSVTSGINNYAIIANNNIEHSSGGLATVNGSVFAGSGGIVVSNGGNKLAFKNGDLICKGVISVNNNSELHFGEDSDESNQLWTDKIDVGTSGNATLIGNVYVANDLLLSGNSAKVTLKNTYFGFGNSTDASEKSSSIIVNGRSCTLNIKDLSKLTLAGVSFIETANRTPSPSPDQTIYDTSDNVFSIPIPMGESLSVKSDQLAYLVPIKCISNFATNPCVFPSTATTTEMTPAVDLKTVLWGTGDDAKTLGNYITGKGEVKVLYKNIDSSNRIVYVFLKFKDKKYANEYFADYFAADPTKVEQYTNLYLSLSDKADNAKINTAGNTFYMDDNATATTADDKLTLNPASENVYAEGAQMLYNKMYSPYLAFVNTEALSKIGSTTLEFKNGNDVVAVVSTLDEGHPYVYGATSSDKIRLIIATNNVSISKAYEGIVIAGKNVVVNNNVTGSPLTSDILNSTCTFNGVDYKLSNFINNSAQLGGASNIKEDLWNLDSLVSYENWTKK